jgi:hypothetical protein
MEKRCNGAIGFPSCRLKHRHVERLRRAKSAGNPAHGHSLRELVSDIQGYSLAHESQNTHAPSPPLERSARSLHVPPPENNSKTIFYFFIFVLICRKNVVCFVMQPNDESIACRPIKK